MAKFGKEATYEDEFEEEVSKSQIKRELLALKDLGKELVELPIKDLDKLQLSERLYEALIKAQDMTKGALKRQIGTIGKLMVHEDYEEIKQKLEKLRQSHNGEVKQFHQLEQWRDELLAGDDNVMTILRNQFEDFDMQHTRQLVRNAKKELEQNKPPKSARLLFKYLQQCQQEQN
jgi:ribosome-associated protein